jgi:pimeloyl-ACP methyl ester carboxylesterase
MAMLKLLLLLAVLYGGVVLLAATFQARLLFPGAGAGGSGRLPATARPLTLRTSGGEQLRGIHIPPTRLPPDRLLAVVFAGNAWNADDAADLVHEFWPEADVIAFHYRGYAPSSGTPSAAAILADAPEVLEAARAEVPGARTIAVGLSIGSGVAASLAGAGSVDGAVLVTPFDSLRKVASDHFWWMPVGLFFRHDMEAATALRRARVPVAIIGGEVDTVIPPRRTAALRQAATTLAYDHVVRGAGHNDIYAHAEFRRAMTDALTAVLASSGSADTH